MTPYPEYKATNLPWLPQVPAHWDWLMLSQLTEEQCVKNIGCQEKNVLSLSYGNIIRKKNIYSGLSPQDFATYQIVFPDNIILRLTDLQNDHRSLRTGLAKEKGIITSAYTCLKVYSNASFVHYLLHAYDLRKVFYGMGGGVRQSIGFKDIRSLRFPVAPASEQEQIVRYLDSMTAKINKLIRAKKKQIALLQEQKQAIINQAVTKGLNPNAEMKDSGIDWLGQIPAHWEVKKAKYCVNINHGSDPVTEGNVPVYGSGAGSFKTCGEFKEGPAVLVGRKGATLHIPHYITGKYWNVDTAFDVKAKKNFFLHFYYFLATCFDYHFYISQTTLPSMTQTDYLNMKLPVPPQKEQYDIIQYLVMQDEKFDNLITEIKNIINSLFEYKNSLIACVVTGQVDVRNIQVEDFDPADLISETDDDPAEDDDQLQEESEVE